jgi:hypothetical protein
VVVAAVGGGDGGVVVVMREGLQVMAVAVVSRGSAVVLCIACSALKQCGQLV